MSLLNLAQPSGTVGANIVPEDEEFKIPSTGAQLRSQAKSVARYQSSIARSNLAETAVNNLMETMTPEARDYVEKYKADWKTVTAVPGADMDDPEGVGGYAPTIDYEEMYKGLVDSEDSPISGDQFNMAMRDELRRASTVEATGKENTLSEAPMLQGMAGGMLAALEDPAEQGSMLASAALGLVTGGTTLARELGLLGLEVGGAAAVTASYQPEVIALYKEMGLEDQYGPLDAVVNVAAGVVLDTGLYGAGKALGPVIAATAGKVATTAKEVVDKIQSAQNKAIADGASPAEVAAATPPPVAKAKKDAEKELISTPTADATPVQKKVAANRLDTVGEDAAYGRTTDPDATGKAQASKGPPAPSTEIAETSEGSVHPGVAIDSAKAQDNVPFNAAAVGRDYVASQREAWVDELKADIANAGKANPVVEKRGKEAEALMPKLDADVKRAEATAKAAKGTPQQAEANTEVKARKAARAAAKTDISNAKKAAKKTAATEKLVSDLAKFEADGTVPTRYRKQVTAAKKAAKQTHKSRAKAKASTSEEIDDIEAQRTEALMNVGMLPDTRPSRLADEGGVDLDADEAYEYPDSVYEEIDHMREQMDSDLPDYTVDEDYNVVEGSPQALADEAEAWGVAGPAVRGCM